MNLDDYDKIPCSAKEAWRWMETKGNYCQQETMPTCIVRISEGRKLEGKILNLTPPDEWSVYDGPGLLAYDWFKLVPKKKERGSYCPECLSLGEIIQYEGLPPKPKRCEIHTPKPCPFHETGCEVSIELAYNNMFRAVADCGASGPWKDSKQEAIDSWNKRYVTPKPDRFAAINTLIATYCDKISATHVMAAFLQDFARAIVDLIEKGKV